ncbi:MAG TPA: CUAEP/CCAEP-tail radical SAM protein [Vicinamibacterales bacterium]|nr:CUAEP/CCAEP-tail radical SAM protein [Vicinamibacterales bacterium]
MRAVLISTYDMGRQPFGLASPAAWLRESGVEVEIVDLSRDPLPEPAVRAAGLIAFFLPMHTATRLALPVIDRVRALNPDARLCAYGLYAPLNAGLLRDRGVEHVLAGEFEADLRNLAVGASAGSGPVPRLEFRVPDRRGLPDLERYAQLRIGGSRRVAGYTEASRGCKHRCRHCPIVPIYDGRFRIVPVDVVMADIHAQVERGARHVTFGDPDFFNGIRHARAIMEGFGREFPGVTYDVTIKVEHLLKHAADLPRLRDSHCAFITTAAESVDDAILARLAKGHTAADFERAVALCRSAGVAVAPTFVAFTPWTTVAGYGRLLEAIDRLDLVEHVAPVQLSIRLLVTQGSRLLELPDIHRAAGPFDARTLTYPWRSPDPDVDRLQQQVARLVGVRLTAPRREVFRRVREIAREFAGLPREKEDSAPVVPRATVPYLDEPWYC